MRKMRIEIALHNAEYQHTTSQEKLMAFDSVIALLEIYLKQRPKDNEMAALGWHQRLRYLRIRANKSQEEVASEANMTQSEVSKIESGKSFNPTLDRIQMLCKVFNVTPGYILD
jgi:DNA-binding XRE family transcriptional regulator